MKIGNSQKIFIFIYENNFLSEFKFCVSINISIRQIIDFFMNMYFNEKFCKEVFENSDDAEL